MSQLKQLTKPEAAVTREAGRLNPVHPGGRWMTAAAHPGKEDGNG